MTHPIARGLGSTHSASVPAERLPCLHAGAIASTAVAFDRLSGGQDMSAVEALEHQQIIVS
jgi:hypothetical protein